MKLRPHHLLCTQGYSGKGYSSDFVENMTAITTHLCSDTDAAVDVVFYTDDICFKCPKMIGDNLCEHNEKVNRFDQKVCDYFGIEEGRYIYQDVVREISAQMTLFVMDDICGQCAWYSMGDCRDSILGGVTKI
ncbi:MAG: DUF1284 domain-containing protein [Oscillospiraceae bacterium]|nr:DUF1284 domain-containing protein [Oscillospiraceae bacterium]